MQLIWLSGPTANVVTVSIGRRTILMAVLALALVLVVLGGILQWMGIRIAVDTHPGLARALGGVTSATEQQQIVQGYEQQIAQLQGRIRGLADQVDRLAAAKQAIVDLIPPPPTQASGLGGLGGPLRRILDFEWFAPKAMDGLVKLNAESQALDHRVQGLIAAWQQELDVLAGLPLQPPIRAEHHLSSDFGFRRDPFSGGFARHTGIDYVAPHGTPILASAPGVVTQAGPQGAYGLAIDIDHGRGFVSRYAHVSKIEVNPGDRVQTGQQIGLLGSTGRSTGPHLHYEVHLDGRPIPPLADSVLQQARTHVQSGAFAPARRE